LRCCCNAPHGALFLAEFKVNLFIQFRREVFVPARQRFRYGPRQFGDLHQMLLDVGDELLLS
jgi:hypothetical protein